MNDYDGDNWIYIPKNVSNREDIIEKGKKIRFPKAFFGEQRNQVFGPKFWSDMQRLSDRLLIKSPVTNIEWCGEMASHHSASVFLFVSPESTVTISTLFTSNESHPHVLSITNHVQTQYNRRERTEEHFQCT